MPVSCLVCAYGVCGPARLHLTACCCRSKCLVAKQRFRVFGLCMGRLQLEGRVNYYVSFGKEPFKTSTVSTSCTKEARSCCVARQGNLSTFLLQRRGCLGRLQLEGRVNYYVSFGKEPFKGLGSPSSVLRNDSLHSIVSAIQCMGWLR